MSDQGALDCDGDGTVDPNAVTGPSLRASDAHLGRTILEISDAAGQPVMR